MKFFIEVCMIAIKSTKRVFEWKMLFYIGCLLIPSACCSSQFVPTDDTVIPEQCSFHPGVGYNIGNLYSAFLLIRLNTITYIFIELQKLTCIFLLLPGVGNIKRVFLWHRHSEGVFDLSFLLVVTTRV